MNLMLKKVIVESGFKQQFIAHKAGIEAVRLSRIIHGHIVPNAQEKSALAGILDKKVAELFKENIGNHTENREVRQ
jgi:transcriptional regulator with XRE-family HTH domain